LLLNQPPSCVAPIVRIDAHDPTKNAVAVTAKTGSEIFRVFF